MLKCPSDVAHNFIFFLWTKLMQILKRTAIDWRERRLISELYMDQRVKVRLDCGRQEVCRLEEELDKDVVCHQFCST